MSVARLAGYDVAGVLMRYLLAVLALCGAMMAADCPKQPKEASALSETEHNWAQSLEKRDVTILGCILANEFQDVGVSGALSDRAATLAKAGEAATGPARHHGLSELRPVVQGDFGYIRGIAAVVDGEGKTLARVRFTDVYAYRDGRWQCVSGQETFIKEAEKK